VTSEPPGERARTWFLDGLCISVTAKTAAEIVAPRAPPEWALGFPAKTPGSWLWAETAARAEVGDPPVVRYPAARPQLEPLVENVGKLRDADDSVGVRVAARAVAERAIRLVRGLSPERVVVNRADATRAALALEVVPSGWHDDTATALGVVEADDVRVRTAAESAARGAVALARERRVECEHSALTTALRDGTVERHLGFA
jgi:hypothetical protein